MAISFEKTFEVMRQKGFSSYRIRKEKLMSQAVLQKLRTGGIVDTRTVDKLCRMLDCQPGELMEYVPDEKDGDAQ